MNNRCHSPIWSPLGCLCALVWFNAFAAVAADRNAPVDFVQRLRTLDPVVLTADERAALGRSPLLTTDVQRRLRAANQRENAEWQAVNGRSEWERFRDDRIDALRRSLGDHPAVPTRLPVRVTGRIEGEGFHIENILFESRPGWWVTGNLYRPEKGAQQRPGIVISHSHHAPKTQGELQDMGMTWARQGCVVLVIDHLGHGERRQHPFQREEDFSGSFRLSRQDYYFRYNTGTQLQLIGDSLMGWMVWDLMRAIDVLLGQPEVDPERLILLGAVAGGGDPAGVTAALDPRVKAVVPFNFGGPQPDYAIPENPERHFYYFGIAYWESTRCLRSGARDGFAHWVIASSVAPRSLVYSHEFAWDNQRDPVWARIQQVFQWYGAGDHLAVAFGSGTLRGQPPESSHCTNIGPLHRSRIYPAFEQWFGMPIPLEYQNRLPPESLLALTEEARVEIAPQPLHVLATELGRTRANAALKRRNRLPADDAQQQLRADWARLLGDVEPERTPTVRRAVQQEEDGIIIDRITLETEPGILVPLLLLSPEYARNERMPAVIMLAQEGKRAFLTDRTGVISDLLSHGVGVCLPDLRGTGETSEDEPSRPWRGGATSLSATEWLLGQTLLGSRLRDVRSVLAWLRTRSDIEPDRIGLWGDSFAQPNGPNTDLFVPLDADPMPRPCEPAGGLLALLAGLFEPEIRAVSVRGCLVDFVSLLESPFLYVPHDAIVPGAVAVGDLPELAAAFAPRPLRIANPVDGLNRSVTAERLAEAAGRVRDAYRNLGANARFDAVPAEDGRRTAGWLSAALVE